MVIKQIISTPETGMNVLNLFSSLIPAFGVFLFCLAYYGAYSVFSKK